MNALNKTLICNPQIEWSKLLSGTSPLSLSASLPVWMCAFDREKMPEVGRKKSTQSQLPGFELALLRQQLASRAWNFTTQLRKQNTRYYVTITRFQKQIKVKKVKLILQLSFAKKKLKRNWSWPSMTDFRDIESVLPCNPTNNGKKIFVTVQKS